jgi:hypothetical protein
MEEIHRRVGGRYEARLVPSGNTPEHDQRHIPGKELGATVGQPVAQLGGRSGEVTAPDGSRCPISIDPDAPDDARYLIEYSFIPNDPVRFTELVKQAFGSDFDRSDQEGSIG